MCNLATRSSRKTWSLYNDHSCSVLLISYSILNKWQCCVHQHCCITLKKHTRSLILQFGDLRTWFLEQARSNESTFLETHIFRMTSQSNSTSYGYLQKLAQCQELIAIAIAIEKWITAGKEITVMKNAFFKPICMKQDYSIIPLLQPENRECQQSTCALLSDIAWWYVLKTNNYSLLLGRESQWDGWIASLGRYILPNDTVMRWWYWLWQLALVIVQMHLEMEQALYSGNRLAASVWWGERAQIGFFWARASMCGEREWIGDIERQSIVLVDQSIDRLSCLLCGTSHAINTGAAWKWRSCHRKWKL